MTLPCSAELKGWNGDPPSAGEDLLIAGDRDALDDAGARRTHLDLHLERFEDDPTKHGLSVADALGPIEGVSREITELEARTGRTVPDVVT